MVDGLTRLLAAVGHHPEALHAQLPGQPGDDLEDMAHHGGILRPDLPAGADVLLGDHQEMGGGLRVDVVEGVAQLVLIDPGRGNLPRDDLAKQLSL